MRAGVHTSARGTRGVVSVQRPPKRREGLLVIPAPEAEERETNLAPPQEGPSNGTHLER